MFFLLTSCCNTFPSDSSQVSYESHVGSWISCWGSWCLSKLNEKKLSSSWCTYYRYVKIICLMYCTGICTIFMMIVRRVRVCHKLGWDTPKLYFQLLNDSETLGGFLGYLFFDEPKSQICSSNTIYTSNVGGFNHIIGSKVLLMGVCPSWMWLH